MSACTRLLCGRWWLLRSASVAAAAATATAAPTIATATVTIEHFGD
jgi:hypothetical protein